MGTSRERRSQRGEKCHKIYLRTLKCWPIIHGKNVLVKELLLTFDERPIIITITLRKSPTQPIMNNAMGLLWNIKKFIPLMEFNGSLGLPEQLTLTAKKKPAQEGKSKNKIKRKGGGGGGSL